MEKPLSNIEVLYSLDEFLWEEELLELQIGSSGDSAGDIGVSKSRLDVPRLAELFSRDGELNISHHSLLLALNSSIFGPSMLPGAVEDIGRSVRAQVESCSSPFVLVTKLLDRLRYLVAYVSTNQLMLNRDTSRISLRRQGSSVSSSSSQLEPSVISCEMRLCLNLLYAIVLVKQHETSFLDFTDSSGLHEALLEALKLFSDTTIPIRKVVLFLFKLLSLRAPDSLVHLPSNSAFIDVSSMSPAATLMHSIPFLSLPALSDFRSFVALALHQNTLKQWTAPSGVRRRPPAVDEGIEICEKHLREFVGSYRFHEAEVEVLRHNEALTNALTICTEMRRNGQMGQERKNLLKPTFASRFSIPQLAHHVIANYQLESLASRGEDESSTEDELPHLPLVHEAYQSCHCWLSSECSQDAIIEAIADAAVPLPPGSVMRLEQTAAARGSTQPGTTTTGNIYYTQPFLNDAIVVLLKLLLAACRGAADPLMSPTNHPLFDLDRDHLLAVLERADIALPRTDDSFRRRNFEIICNAISGILLLLLKQHVSESEFIQRKIVANNGCLVLLKIITSFPTETDGFFSPKFDSIFPALKANKSYALAMPARLPTTLFRSLKCLYILCKHNVSRIKKYLVHYKVAVVLKRFFACPNVALLAVAYKLFKIQMRYLGRKWKIMHIKLISCCYNATSLDMVDDWLLNDPDVADTSGPGDEVLNDSQFPPPSTEWDMTEYIETLRRINFENSSEIQSFCDKFGESRETFFGSKCVQTYSEWKRFHVGF